MKYIVCAVLMVASFASGADNKSTIEVFKKGEWSVDSFYNARFSGDFEKHQNNYGVGVGYSLTKNIVVGVDVSTYNTTPNFVNEVSGRIAYRAPIGNFAPYAFTYGGGNIQTGEGFAGAGGGVELRFATKSRIKPFIAIEADLRETTSWTASIGAGLKAGISF